MSFVPFCQRTGIADGWEIEFRPPVTAADLKYKR